MNTLMQFKRAHLPSAKGKMAPPSDPEPLPPERRQLLAALLDVLVQQLAWPKDAEWELPIDEDEDDEVAIVQNKRMVGSGWQS